MLNIKEKAEMLFVKLKNTPPPAEVQAEMMVNAMKTKMAKGTYMTIEQLDDRYVKITGDELGPKKEILAHHVVGRAGEVLIHDSITEFLESAKMRERYGVTVIEGTARILLPVDFNTLRRSTNVLHKYFKPLERKMLQLVENEWAVLDAGSSVGDFVMQNMYPIESKTKLQSYAFITEGGKESYNPSKAEFTEFKNEYIKQATGMGGKVMVGATAFDAVFAQVLGEKAKEMSRAWAEVDSRKRRQKEGRLFMYDLELSNTNLNAAREGRLFKMVGVRVNMFVPLTLDKGNFKTYLKRTIIKPGDEHSLYALSNFSMKVVDALVRKYIMSQK